MNDRNIEQERLITATNESIKVKRLRIPIKNLIISNGLLLCSIFLGGFLKFAYHIHRENIGHLIHLTGIPILRTYFFMVPIILSLVSFYKIYSIFSLTSNRINSRYLFWHYMNKFRLSFLASNIALLIIFYFLYFSIYLPLWHQRKYRLSGHTLAAVFSNAVVINIINICNKFKNNLNIQAKFFNLIQNICYFLLIHNLYTLVWTCYVFHTFSECLLSYFISLSYVLVLESINIDRLVIILISGLYPITKTRNIL